MRIVSMRKARRFPSGVALPLAGALTGLLAAWVLWAPKREATVRVPATPAVVSAPAPRLPPRPILQQAAPPVAAAPAVPPPAPEPKPSLRVLSIVPGSEGPRVVFVAADSPTVLSAGEGEEVAGYRVLQIEDGAAVIGHGQELERIPVEPRSGHVSPAAR